MHICLVTNEFCKVPSGVVTVILELCLRWSDNDRITILINRHHWAGELLKDTFQGINHINVLSFPWVLMSEWSHRIDNYNFSRYLNLYIKIVFRLLEILLAPAYIIRIFFLLRKNNINGILNHNGGWPGGVLNRLVVLSSRLAGIRKNYLVIHNTPVAYSLFIKKIRGIRDRIVGLSCTDIITVSEACRNSLEKDTGFKRNVRVVYDGIDVIQPKLKHLKQPPWPKKHITIGFVGELHPRKGVHVLLNAVSRLAVPCEVVLIGNGDEEYTRQLEYLAQSYKWPTHFLGYRNDTLDLYQWLDIVVLPSLQFESFGMVLLEAMMWNKPVICSDFGGMKEVVVHKETGFVVPANDLEALTDSINHLIENESVRNRMGDLGRKRLVSFFSGSMMVHSYEGLFHGSA